MAKIGVCHHSAARSHRAYVAMLDQGELLQPETVLDLDDIRALVQEKQLRVYGDAHLLGMESCPFDLLANFASLRPFYRPVENVHTLTPRYLKDQSAYHLEIK